MELKKCLKCKDSKPATDEYFYRKKGYLTSPCKVCQQKKQKKTAKKTPPRPKKDAAKVQAAYRTRNKKRLDRAKKSDRSDDRLLALWHYGGQPPDCACCGEDRIQFLGIGPDSHRFYRELRRKKFPTGYEVLCHNCRISISRYGECPHAPGQHGPSPAPASRKASAAPTPSPS